MMTYFTPMSVSMFAASSPVKAPLASKCMVSAPTATFVPLKAFWAAVMFSAGMQSTTSLRTPAGSRPRSSVAKATVSDAVLFIFQLPAMMVLR